jgi:hypothetical protein
MGKVPFLLWSLQVVWESVPEALGVANTRPACSGQFWILAVPEPLQATLGALLTCPLLACPAGVKGSSVIISLLDSSLEKSVYENSKNEVSLVYSKRHFATCCIFS